MKLIKFIFFLILTAQIVLAQKTVVSEYSSIDKKALQLPESLTKSTSEIAIYFIENFKTDKEKSRAIFIWIVSNIRYDIDNMFAVNFHEKKEDKIAKVLKTRKGICENYALLFSDICIKSGIKSFVIEGYTKQNDKVDTIPHAWCAALVDGSWVLFDPTWGSGYVNGGEFFKKINYKYYKASPSLLIKSHIPFDYLWQFLNYPITNQEFYQGKTEENKTKPFFNFNDSIKVYEKQSRNNQLISSANRVEKNGIKNALIFDKLKYLKLEIENNKQTKTVDLYNSAVIDYNEGINGFNDFINYRNKQFIPNKTDPEIQIMIDNADNKLKEAKIKLGKISNTDANTTNMLIQLKKAVDDAITHVNEQKNWLKLYFSKSKSNRKSMFYERKSSLFGIPLN